MPMCGVGTETCINPEAQTAAKLAANFGNGFVSRLVIKPILSFLSRHRKKQKLRNTVVKIFFNLSQCRWDIMTDVAAQSGNRFLVL